MEAEVVRMTCNLFHGDPNESCGTVKYEIDYKLRFFKSFSSNVIWFQMTSGGTESLILACKAYKEYAKKEKGVTKPNMVLPVS